MTIDGGNLVTLNGGGTRRAGEDGTAFFVSNDRTGHLVIDGSTLRRNPADEFSTAGYPGFFYLGSGPPVVTD